MTAVGDSEALRGTARMPNPWTSIPAGSFVQAAADSAPSAT